MPGGFAVALLMGGRSRRMGVDKAMLREPVRGVLAWERQVKLLGDLEPEQCLLSLREGQDVPENLDSRWEVVRDVAADVGPIGGLEGCLDACVCPFLLTLGVDLLAMRAEVLGRLLSECEDQCGVVAMSGEGFYEPLAAIYPEEAVASARAFRESGGRRLQEWLRELEELGMMRGVRLEDDERGAFVNVNDAEAFAALKE